LPEATTEQRGEVLVVTVPGGGHFKVAFDSMRSRDLFIVSA